MTSTRRKFFGVLAAVIAAPFVVKQEIWHEICVIRKARSGYGPPTAYVSGELVTKFVVVTPRLRNAYGIEGEGERQKVFL